MCEFSCVLRLWFQYHWIENEKSHTSIETPQDDLLQVPLRAADSRLQFQQGANNLKVNILVIFIFVTIRNGLPTSQSPGPLWRGSSSTSLSPASHWSQFLYGGIIKDNKQLWQIFKDNLTTTNQKKIFYSTWILTQCSWAGANSWLLPVPSQDRGEHFEQSTKSSTRERDDQHDHDKQQWVAENDLNDNNMIGRWTTKTRMDNCRLNWTWSR